jgi:hypothetical protein
MTQLNNLFAIETATFVADFWASKKQPGMFVAGPTYDLRYYASDLEAMEGEQALWVQTQKTMTSTMALGAPGPGYEVVGVDGGLTSSRTYWSPELAMASVGVPFPEWRNGFGGRGEYWSSGPWLVRLAQAYRPDTRRFETSIYRSTQAQAWYIGRLENQ